MLISRHDIRTFPSEHEIGFEQRPRTTYSWEVSRASEAAEANLASSFDILAIAIRNIYFLCVNFMFRNIEQNIRLLWVFMGF